MVKNSGNAAKTLLLTVLIIAGAILNLMQWRNLGQERARLALEKQQLELANTKLAAMKELEKRSDQMEAELEILAQLLPGEPEEDMLILDLQSGADLSAMRFVQVRFAERRETSGTVEMPFQCTFEGGYHELLHFLDYLQVYERAVRVDELRVDKNEDLMTVNIRASAFYAAD